MRPIEQETSVDVLREYTKWLEAQVFTLSKEVSVLRDEQELSKQQWLESSLKDQLHRLQKKFYGFGGERFSNQSSRAIGHKDDQLRLHSEHTAAKEDLVQKSHDSAESTVYELNSDELKEESLLRGLRSNAKGWEPMKDFYKESTEITVTERVYKKVIHKQARYRLKDEYNTTGKEVIITAPGPVKVKPGCQYSVDFALAVVSDKYEYHLPLERQRRKMEASGLDVEVKTLYNLCEMVAEHCAPVIEKIRDDIMGDFCAVHVDESPWRIISTQTTGQMWVMSNRIGSVYRFEPTRSGKVAQELLDGYRGAIVTDGFSGYNALRRSERIRAGHCWAHARREFFERLKDFPEDSEKALEFIDEVFALEAKARTFEELRSLRKNEIRTVVENYKKWLESTRDKYLPGEGIRKAIEYSISFWSELTLFLKDLSVPIDNNDAERALRHVVMGKKNFSGSKTIDGADTAATLYTVIESAKRVGLQPKEYLRYVITERWHKREPLSPHQYSVKFRNASSRVQFPDKEDWRI